MPLRYNPFTGVPIPVGNVTVNGNGGSGQTWKVDRIPQQSPDGDRVVFSLPSGDTYINNSLSVILNGQVLTKENDYSETTDSTFTLVLAPSASDIVRLNYRTA